MNIADTLDRTCIRTTFLLVLGAAIALPITGELSSAGGSLTGGFGAALAVSVALQSGRSTEAVVLSALGTVTIIAAAISASLGAPLWAYYICAGTLLVAAVVSQLTFFWLSRRS